MREFDMVPGAEFLTRFFSDDWHFGVGFR